MKIIKKILVLIMIIALTNTTFTGSIQNNVYANLNATTGPVRVGVFLFNSNDPYISLVKQNLENIQKENENKVEFTFFDAKENQSIQNESIDNVLSRDGADLLILNLVDTNIPVIQDIINKIQQKNIPLVLYVEPTPEITNFIRSYNKAVFVATDAEQSGALQGKILVDVWNTNKKAIDKNNDNVLQYVMLFGAIDSPVAIARTKYSVLAINNAGIKTQELALKICEWKQDCAKNIVDSLLLSYDGKIEAIIANNDAMAIGAIEALQKQGYNKGDPTKTISVVGVDAIPQAQDLIKKGFMTGTVIQNPRETAEALYSVGMNLISSNYPLKGTNYKFDSTGNVIHLPYHEYIK